MFSGTTQYQETPLSGTTQYQGTLEVKKPLQKGSRGYVYLCRDRQTKQFIANKVIFMDKDYDRTLVEREIKIGQCMRGAEHLVQYVGYIHDKETRVQILYEYINGGDLFTSLDTFRTNVERIKICIYSLAKALETMHDRGFVHNDLKPENILIHYPHDSNPPLVIKLGDFDRSMPLHSPLNLEGTLDYVSPEQLNLVPGSIYTEKVDLWALGCVLYELCFGIPPFETDSESKTITKIKQGLYDMKLNSTICDPNAFDLIKKLLKVKPSKRLTLQQVLQHPFLSSSKTTN